MKNLLMRKAIDPEATDLYQVDVGFACGGVVVKNDTVIDAAPIFMWMKGRHWPTLQKWDKIVSVSHV